MITILALAIPALYILCALRAAFLMARIIRALHEHSQGRRAAPQHRSGQCSQ